MDIGIIGAGKLGTALAKHFVKRGHEVMLSFSKDSAKLMAISDSYGARAGTLAEAVRFGDVIVLATPWTATADALRQVGVVPENKILWDCTNPFKPDLSELMIGTTTSGGEEVAKLAPWARVVKAIPPFAEVLHSSSSVVGGARPAVFVCGDDAQARKIVVSLVEEIGGMAVDAGPLCLARYTEPACMLLVSLAYVQGFGPRIGLTLVRDGPEPVAEAASLVSAS
jgi:8-hydroxy-5-deazaflavin:NADPH oxidoreductase